MHAILVMPADTAPPTATAFGMALLSGTARDEAAMQGPAP